MKYAVRPERRRQHAAELRAATGAAINLLTRCARCLLVGVGGGCVRTVCGRRPADACWGLSQGLGCGRPVAGRAQKAVLCRCVLVATFAEEWLPACRVCAAA